MATSFVVIYDRAISEFDDPQITQAYTASPISFFQIMYNFLNNAIPLFNNPLSIQVKLANRTAPDGELETFDGDGINTKFFLSSTPLADSYFEYTINSVASTGTYSSVDNSVTFPSIIPVGQQATCEWYYAGQFNDSLSDNIQRILSKLLVVCWGEKEKNYLLDIRRLLNDTDFKLYSEANSIRAKTGWYNDMREDASKLANQYAWNLKMSETLSISLGE